MLSRLIVAVTLIAGCGDDSDHADLPPAVGQFPDGFLWGTAIAPYQVEGDLHETDWYQWETLCGSRCSGDTADDGPAFLSHYEEDLDAARAMGNNAIRIGIDWSRRFPPRRRSPTRPTPMRSPSTTTSSRRRGRAT